MKIINLRGKSTGHGEFVIVDRSSPWGNPYFMKTEAQRGEVCDKFEPYAVDRLKKEPRWLDHLRDQNLACWCAPKRCHAETLMRLANEVRL